MELWIAFLLGLAGSLHCAGMCGPLALALPMAGRTGSSFLLSRAIYNLGRLVTYGLFGLLCGLLGGTLALAGLQRWVSLAAGGAILAGLFFSSRLAVGAPVTRAVAGIKLALGRLLQQRSLSALLMFGALNGLLPCGLVYVACAGAVAAGGLLTSVEYMLVFGLGTVPMMLGISLAGNRFPPALRFKLQRFIPACLLIVGLLLILRGMSLGIPFLSPEISNTEIRCPACQESAPPQQSVSEWQDK